MPLGIIVAQITPRSLSPWQIASSSAAHEFPNVWVNQKIHCRIHKSSPLAPILREMNQVYDILFSFSKRKGGSWDYLLAMRLCVSVYHHERLMRTHSYLCVYPSFFFIFLCMRLGSTEILMILSQIYLGRPDCVLPSDFPTTILCLASFVLSALPISSLTWSLHSYLVRSTVMITDYEVFSFLLFLWGASCCVVLSYFLSTETLFALF
jgi:hypothetical protein